MVNYEVLVGDCRETLKTLPDESVHCVVTSPPYFGLRDYGTGKWEGGDSECDHKMSEGELDPKRAGGDAGSSHTVRFNRERCHKCGAKRIDDQIGLEPTPEDFVVALVEVFREVRRVLRDDGTVWLNLGDSYAGSWGNYGGENRGNGTQREITNGSQVKDHTERYGLYCPPTANVPGLKPKDLIGIPWRVAFALQADGWYLRQDIVWSKPNPMPESVKDRCTKSHEYVFLLTKSPRYCFDNEAIKEPAKTDDPRRPYTSKGAKDMDGRAEWKSGQRRDGDDFTTRNRRSVWTVTTKPFKGAHFATYPPDLIEPCILAGCPEGGTVLDPFGGSGTTAGVALKHGRKAILCELNPEYAALIPRRIENILGYNPEEREKQRSLLDF